MKPFDIIVAFCLMPIASILAATEPVSIPWLEDNLVQNADFEEVTGDTLLPRAWAARIEPDKGATVAIDNAVFLKGRRALRIDVPRSDADDKPDVVVSSAPIPVTGNALYLVSLAFRQEGFNSAGQPSQFEGVSSYPLVHWLDDQQKPLGRSTVLSAFPYGPCRWGLSTSTAHTRRCGKSCRLCQPWKARERTRCTKPISCCPMPVGGPCAWLPTAKKSGPSIR